MTSRILFGLASASVIGTLLSVAAVDFFRDRAGRRSLMNRYQSRAGRSVTLAVLHPEPWTDRPYGTFKPEDVNA